MGRPTFAIVGMVVLFGVLTGCTSPGPTPAASAWLDQTTADRNNIAGRVGVAAGQALVQEPTSGTNGITLNLTGLRPVSVADVRCFGGGTITVDIQIQTATQGHGIRTDVDCDEQGHQVQLGYAGTALTGATSLTISAWSSSPTTYYADIMS